MNKKQLVHIFPDISRSKDNETMKFDQFVEHNTRNSFPETSCTKYGETSRIPFFARSILSISLSQQAEVSCSLDLLYA